MPPRSSTRSRAHPYRAPANSTPRSRAEAAIAQVAAEPEEPRWTGVRKLSANTDMPGSPNKVFYDAACWAFGFMGVRDDPHLRQIGETFQQFGTEAAAGKVPFATNLDASKASQRMAQLKNKLLEDAGSPVAMVNGQAVPITIYGKFKGDADITPDHVWIECAGMIWETFPREGLTICDATTKSRAHPPLLVNEIPNSFRTGWVDSHLTEAQLANVKLFNRSLKADERIEARIARMQEEAPAAAAAAQPDAPAPAAAAS